MPVLVVCGVMISYICSATGRAYDLTEYVKEAKYKTLTPEPVAAYILAKETEAKCVRIIMTCKLHNIDAETIKERVREAYV